MKKIKLKAKRNIGNKTEKFSTKKFGYIDTKRDNFKQKTKQETKTQTLKEKL